MTAKRFATPTALAASLVVADFLIGPWARQITTTPAGNVAFHIALYVIPVSTFALTLVAARLVTQSIVAQVLLIYLFYGLVVTTDVWLLYRLAAGAPGEPAAAGIGIYLIFCYGVGGAMFLIAVGALTARSIWRRVVRAQN